MNRERGLPKFFGHLAYKNLVGKNVGVKYRERNVYFVHFFLEKLDKNKTFNRNS
jgi:hypothetical protein